MALTQLTKIDGGGISTTSDYRVGVITATKFIGPFEGSTGTFSGNITAVDGTFSGNVTVGGTLTYEDVTNIDSVGILTARSGIFIDDSITHIGDTNTKIRFPSADTIQFETGGTQRVTVNNTTGVNTLDVLGGARADYFVGRSNQSAPTADAAIYRPADNTLAFVTASTERLRITSAGKVGIGTDNPNVALELLNDSPGLRLTDKNSSAGLLSYTQLTNINGNTYVYTRANSANGSYLIGGHGGGTFDEHIRITTAGKVGINTNNPEARLHVSDGHLASADNFDSNIVLAISKNTTTSSWAGLALNSGNAAGSFIHFGDTDDSNVGRLDYDHTANSFKFYTNGSGAEALRITSDGRVNIGQASDVDHTLCVAGTDNTTSLTGGHNQGIQLQNKSTTDGTYSHIEWRTSSGGRYARIAGIQDDANGNGGQLVFLTETSGGATTERLRITSDGKMGLGTNNPATTFVVDKSDNSGLTAHILVNNSESSSGVSLVGAGSAFSNSGWPGITDAAIIRSSAGSANGIAYHATNGYHSFWTGSGTAAEKVRITSAGLVGIGTVNPESGQLQVIGNGYHQINISAHKTANANRGGGISFLNYEGDRTSIFQTYASNSSNTIYYGSADSSARGVQYHNFYVNASRTATTNHALALRIDSSGHVTPGALGTQNFGSTSKGWGHIYIADDKQLTLGNDSNLYIKHSNGHANNFIVSSVGDIEHHMALSKKIIKGFNNSGTPYVNLYQGDNNIRLTTTATGIEVTGEVAASQDYPNQRPSVDFNFASVKKLDPRFTYRCTGPASYTDEFGKVVLVGHNTPRFDHNPTTRECKGLLIEESRTNYVRQSLTLATDWSAGSGSYGYDAAITNPDGSVGAYYHTGAELYHQNIDLSGASTNVTTVSMWVKERSGHTGVMDIEMFQQISGGAVSMGAFTVNPITGTITTGGARWSDGTVTEYPNGWYRFTAKATTASGNFSSSTRLDIQNNEHYVWGMQVEVGDFPTSFIPTRGSTATRGQGFAVIDGEELSDFYNPNASTVICQFDTSNWMTYNFNRYERIFCFGNLNSENEVVEMFKSNTSATEVRWRIRSGGSNVLGAANTTYSPNSTPKFGMAWQLNDGGVCVDGGTVTGTADSGIPIPSITQLSLGNSGIETNNGGHGLTGWIRRFIYYPIKVSDAQLVTLTS